MKKIFLFSFLISSLFAKWQMFQGGTNSFLFNDETGEVYRHYQVVAGNGEFLKEEGMVRVKFTTYTKYPVGSQMVPPTGNTPQEMKTMENKLLDRLSQ